jgi:hypothetical protein
MNTLYKIAVVLIMLFFRLAANGQTEAVAKLDTTDITIGDQIKLHLSFSGPKDIEIAWPQITDTIVSDVEVIDRTGIDTIPGDNNNLYTQNLTITSFDSGYYAIPPFRFNYRVKGDTVLHFAETSPLLLGVHTVEVDTTKAFKDIKMPIAAPYTFREALPWILLGLGIILIAYLIFYYLKKKKQDEPVFKARKPKLPPHQIAFDALENLRFKKLWQNGKVKEYHTELTDILRTYISEKFGVHALEMTTEEIVESLEPTPVNEQALAKIKETFVLADLVKFAKAQPLPVENDLSLNNAIDFVKETMHITLGPVQIPENEKKPEESDKDKTVEEVDSSKENNELEQK